MKTFFMLSAMIGLFFGAITVYAAPATANHPLVKEIVNLMLNKPDNMEKKIADAVDRFKVENGKPSYEKANQYLGKKFADFARFDSTPAGVSKREYFTNTVIAYLQQY